MNKIFKVLVVVFMVLLLIGLGSLPILTVYGIYLVTKLQEMGL